MNKRRSWIAKNEINAAASIRVNTVFGLYKGVPPGQNTPSRAHFQSRISLTFCFEILNPILQMSQIPLDPEKPTKDPQGTRGLKTDIFVNIRQSA